MRSGISSPLSGLRSPFSKWYDPDYIAAALATRAGIDWRPWQLSTLFTDTAGTVQATAPGDIIAVMKSPSKAGVQFQQTTLAIRPVLVRHPKRGRVNELVGTATMSTQSVTTTAAQRTLSFTGTGTVTLSGTSTAGPLVGTGVSDRVSLTFTPTAGTLTLTVSGSVTDAQLQLGAAFDSLQTVNATGTSITEQGQSECWGLQHDGTDNMITAAAVDFSGSDKLATFAAITPQVSPNASFLRTLGHPSNGSFLMFRASGSAIAIGSRGTIYTEAYPGNAPDNTGILITGIHSISGDRTFTRINSVPNATATGDKGTGNFANDVIRIGDLVGITWGGAVVSGLDNTTDAALIAAIEKQIAANTPGVYL